MRVRDELSGVEFDTSQVLYIAGISGGHTPRDRTISHGVARGFECNPSFSEAKPWALSADHDCWVPVQVLPPSREDWLKSLKTGDKVAVVDAPNGRLSGDERVIYVATVHRTAKRLFLDGNRRLCWLTGARNDPGAGWRFIVPVKQA